MTVRPTWDPQQYLRHAGHRTRPFLDLLARVDAPAPACIADLGCGAGNVTALLADRWPAARITGYDNSPQMLERAERYAGPLLDFVHADAATWGPDEATYATYDLIVSNALLQWVPDHADRFPAWLDALTPGGTFAFQVPGNFTAPSHTILAALRDSPRWRGRLGGVGERAAAVLEPGDYLTRLTALGCEADVWETTYLQVLLGKDPVLDWVKGTALRPVLTALADDPQASEAFVAEYAEALRGAYPTGPHGTVFPFRRIFAVARKGDGLS
ncbi:trans-aconitate 2-methyltransferase [Streptomyces sp. ISL-100]|uniref:trans-aconitate 2-methyltransferase n=1 Tax=Streptomyces sp. ISL-100 TaxID=2819173 RepID=UPI001BEB8C07|nr:trans-aconitate 2-methyltransferase [Streptomyces sp. ISL-100]MBT2399723.1 trans-aconitate 2-methyltransferase [Streptomyces sp. ISL-100]